MILHPSLKDYWNKQVSELVHIETPDLDHGLRERHRLYSLMLMSVIHYYWNGNKRGRNGVYPLNLQTLNLAESPYLDRDYLGHNIAAIAVDGNGYIVDFDFNHNEIFSSSAEHAEMRVVKRVYSLSQINDSWQLGNNPERKYRSFSDLTLYTSLESCAQCSGVMTLARVKEIVYLQSDPGQYLIGNIMRNLSREGDDYPAPRPLNAAHFDFEYCLRLDEAYSAFYKAEPLFFIDSEGKSDYTKSMTSFLCTEEAYLIYSNAKREFMDYIQGKKLLQFGLYVPDRRSGVLTNEKVLQEVKDFYEYAIYNGRRGTAH